MALAMAAARVRAHARLPPSRAPQARPRQSGVLPRILLPGSRNVAALPLPVPGMTERPATIPPAEATTLSNLVRNAMAGDPEQRDARKKPVPGGV